MHEAMPITHKVVEDIMLSRLLEAAKKFYQDPKNCQSYEVWLKNKEAVQNAADNINA